MREDYIGDDVAEIKRIMEYFGIPSDATLVKRSGDDGDGTEFFLFEHDQKYCIIAHYDWDAPETWSHLLDTHNDYWDQWNSKMEGTKDLWFNGSGKLIRGMFGDSLKDPDYEYEWGDTYLTFAFDIKDILT